MESIQSSNTPQGLSDLLASINLIGQQAKALQGPTLDEQIAKQLEDKNISKEPIGIPNALTPEIFEEFYAVCEAISRAPESGLKQAGLFLMSMCNSLMFERSIMDREVKNSAEIRYQAIGALIKTQLLLDKAKSPSLTNFRTQF